MILNENKKSKDTKILMSNKEQREMFMWSVVVSNLGADTRQGHTSETHQEE